MNINDLSLEQTKLLGIISELISDIEKDFRTNNAKQFELDFAFFLGAMNIVNNMELLPEEYLLEYQKFAIGLLEKCYPD